MSMTKPKLTLIRSIHLPGLGRSREPKTLAINSGNPIPKPKIKRYKPPKTALCVCATNNNAPASGALIHGPTINADNAPMNIAPNTVPAF